MILFLYILLAIVVTFYYIRFSVRLLSVENYKKAFFFHITTCFLSVNLFLYLVPTVIGDGVKQVGEYSALHWLLKFASINHFFIYYPEIVFTLALSLAFSAFIVCLINIYHIFFEY